MAIRDAIPVLFAITLLEELKNLLVHGNIATKKHSDKIKEKGDRNDFLTYEKHNNHN